jgi:phosphoribosyl-AMP cyclohydrolase
MSLNDTLRPCWCSLRAAALEWGHYDETDQSMATINQLEEGTELRLDFGKLEQVARVGGVLPCAVQNADTGEVILVAYVNEAALNRAIETRSAVFWSTSRNELWEKGKTSGETFDLLEVRVNCEQNSLLYVVRPRKGGICHTKNAAGEARNCYYRRLNLETGGLENLAP